MTLANLLSAEQIVPDMKTTARWEAIGELVDVLVKAGKIRDEERELVLESIKQREQTMSTGIGFGIAIPHARMTEVKKLVGLFARLDHPVDFEALDDQPSDLIFLLLAPDSADADSLKALARISRLLRDSGLQRRLRQERDRDAVYRMLTQKPESHAA